MGWRDWSDRSAFDAGRCSAMYGAYGPLAYPNFAETDIAPSLESLMADINTTLETLTARIDQLVADLQATNPTVAATPPARTRWTFETEEKACRKWDRFVCLGDVFIAEDDHIGSSHVIVPGSVTRDPDL